MCSMTKELTENNKGWGSEKLFLSLKNLRNVDNALYFTGLDDSTYTLHGFS